MANFLVGQLAYNLTDATVDAWQKSRRIEEKAIAARSAPDVWGQIVKFW